MKRIIMMVVLDPSLSVTNYTNDATAFTFSFWNAQGTYYGIAACLSSAKGKSQGGYVSRLTDTINGETKLITGGEQNGNYCWCRLTHPVSSLWVFNNSNSTCASHCADHCGRNARSNAALRGGLFGYQLLKSKNRFLRFFKILIWRDGIDNFRTEYRQQIRELNVANWNRALPMAV